MRKNITAPQLNRALDQLQDFLELLPEFGRELFVTDDTIWISMKTGGNSYEEINGKYGRNEHVLFKNGGGRKVDTTGVSFRLRFV